MKILLVQPSGTGIPHMGLMYISAALKKDGYSDITLCSIQNNPSFPERSYDYYIDFLKENKPDIVGITSESPVWHEAAKLCEDAKKYGTFVIVGGPGPSSMPDKIFSKFTTIDALVFGEGDNTISQIVERIENSEDFEGINGVIYRKNDKIIKNNPNPLIKNLDGLPFPDRDILNMNHYHTPFTILTSRGCPYDCCFCFKPVHGRVWRARSPKNVVDEIEYLIKKYKGWFEKSNRIISIQDDNFNLDKQRVKDIADEIIKRNIRAKFTFVNGLHVRTVDLEMFQEMKEAGTVEIWFGVDAGSKNILNKLGKSIDNDMVRNAVALARKAKIPRVGAHFIIGLPEETPETAKEALEFAKSLKLDVVGFNHANILPGTKLWEWVQKNGTLLWPRKDEFDFSMYRQLAGMPIFETKEFIKEDRIKAYNEAICYTDRLMKRKLLSYKTIARHLSEVKSPQDLIWLIRNGIRYIFSKDLARSFSKTSKPSRYKEPGLGCETPSS